MQSLDPSGLQNTTIDDTRRLLGCVSDLHGAIAPERAALLARRLMSLLAAEAVAVDVAVDVAGAEGPAARLAAIGEPPPPDATANDESISAINGSAGPGPDAGRGSLPRPAVIRPRNEAAVAAVEALIQPEVTLQFASSAVPPDDVAVDEAEPFWPAGARSVLRHDGVTSILSAWRGDAFDARATTLLRLLHPHVAMFLTVPLRPGLPAATEVVLELMLTGLPEKEIARRLGRSTHTVHAHIKRVYRHYAVNSRPELIVHLREPRRAGR